MISVGVTARFVFQGGRHIYIQQGEEFYVGIYIESKENERRKEECMLSGWAVTAAYEVAYFMLVSQKPFRLPGYRLLVAPELAKQAVVLGYPQGERGLSYSSEDTRMMQGFTIVVGNHARPGMAGGPLLLYDGEGNPEMAGVLVAGSWVPSKRVGLLI